MATVEFRSVEKSYGSTHVVKGVDLTVADGELVVLVGPSGCGKSTMLRMVAGLEDLSGGKLLIDGEVVNDRPPRARDVAMVFQSYALYPHMTVRRNLAFGLEVRKSPKKEIERRVAEAAEMLGLVDLLDRYPRQLSGGQRQRVAMGRAIVRRPKVFLFDEPLSNLDASLRVVMRVELARLHRRLGVTMIYVTHDQVEAMTLADRIAVLDAGILQQVGTPDELYDRPKNKFVGSFIGSPSMNFLSGTVCKKNDEFWVTGEGFDLEVAPRRVAGLEGGDRDVIVGVRPHDLTIGQEGGIAATVDVIEPMGWESLVYATFGDGLLVIHSESGAASQLEPGATVKLAAAPDRVHLFDAATERSLAWS